jgi:hypothetical protein
MRSRKTHFGKRSFVFSDALKNFASEIRKRTPDGSNVIRKALSPFAFGTERTAKQEVLAQQSGDSIKVSRVPNATVKLLNKFRHTHANHRSDR